MTIIANVEDNKLFHLYFHEGLASNSYMSGVHGLISAGFRDNDAAKDPKEVMSSLGLDYIIIDSNEYNGQLNYIDYIHHRDYLIAISVQKVAAMSGKALIDKPRMFHEIVPRLDPDKTYAPAFVIGVGMDADNLISMCLRAISESGILVAAQTINQSLIPVLDKYIQRYHSPRK